MPSAYVAQDWYRRNSQLVRIGSGPYVPVVNKVAGASKTYTATTPLTSQPNPTIRPEGADYIRYEDLYVTGDSVTDAMARLTTAKYITFPEGKFEGVDFVSNSSKPGYYQACITVPRIARGIIGSGRGTLGGSTGTVFTMKENSSTAVAKGWIPAQGTSQPVQTNVFKHYPLSTPTYKNFQVAGTAQGHVFSLFQSFGVPSGSLSEDLLLCGWDGNNGAPPGETSAFAIAGNANHTMRRVEVDGRRTPGGEVFGAMGLTFQNSVNNLFEDCNVHHCRAACFVFYNAYNSTLLRCIVDAAPTDMPSSKYLGNGCMNLEVTSGTKLINSKLIGRPNKIHITMSNDFGSRTQDGVTYSAAGGTLEVIDCTWNDIWGNGQLYVQSWSPYSRGPATVGSGNSMQYPGATGSDNGYPNDGPSCAPYVHTSAGVRTTNYRWVFDKHYVNPTPHYKLVP